jgi:hypothetical protein
MGAICEGLAAQASEGIHSPCWALSGDNRGADVLTPLANVDYVHSILLRIMLKSLKCIYQSNVEKGWSTYTAERQRAQPYLSRVTGPLYEQWYLLHHRMVRVVTNHSGLANQVRHFLYYADLLAQVTYESPLELPVAIPDELLWQAGQQLHRPVALTCFLFETYRDEPFPPAPAETKPDDVGWDEISGLDGPLRARWEREALRFREFQPYPGVTGRINTVLDTQDLHATVFIEDMDKCSSWFVMRYVFYMIIGAMLGYDGYEIVHAGAIALNRQGMLLVGSPGSGKTTLVLSCLLTGMQLLADDVLFLAKDDGVVKVHSFPEDIGVRSGTAELFSRYEFVQTLTSDERRKRFVDVQQYFRGQVVSSCPVRLIVFLHAESRSAEFRAGLLTPVKAVSWLMQEYISRQRAKLAGADRIFHLFTDMAAQAPAYHLWLSPDLTENAIRVRALLAQHTALHAPGWPG